MYSIAFDLGNVIFSFDYTIAFKKIKNKKSLPGDVLTRALFQSDLALSFEKGLISSQEFHLKFNETFLTALSYDEFIDVWCDIFSPIQETMDLIKRLESRYPLYLISNINELHFTYLYQRYPDIFSLFKDLILSYKIQAVKPEEKIYKALAATAKADLKNIVYIDDREDLISEAKKFGLKCVQFINPKGRIPRACPWMNGISHEGRQAKLEL